MNENSIIKALTNAYNNFDSRPLSGETLDKYYIDDFTKDAVNSIRATITISEKFKKMLVVGHRGCGKSTILNKVTAELKNDFHIISFSAANTLNMNDVETIDILISIYLQLVNFMNDNKINVSIKTFDEIMTNVKNKLQLTEVGINLLRTLSFKIKVENESRIILREEFKNKIKALDNAISNCISRIDISYEESHRETKEVLIIIDDLDKLDIDFSKRVFFKDSNLLTMPKTKIIYTFPLETYYCEEFNTFKDLYEDQFISLVVINKNINGNVGIEQLKKLILKRIDRQYITDEALEEMIIYSGGLLRDLIKFMQDACKEAIVNNSKMINKNIAEEVINEAVNHYDRLFDFPNYINEVEKIVNESKRASVTNKNLIYLLNYLFILEYRFEDKLWYEAHPCLEKVLMKNC